MSIASAKVPVVIATGIICLLVGLGGGIVVASYVDLGLKQAAKPEDNPDQKDAIALKGGGMPGGMGGMGKGGGMPGGAKGGDKAGDKGGDKAGAKGTGGGGKGGFTPNPKTQLTQLVAKLDTLTKKPLVVELTPDQKKQVKELLADLDGKESLSDDDAKAKYEAILKLVEGNKETFEAAGFRWSGGAFAPPGDPPANPFKEGEPASRLKSLRETIGK